MTKKYLNCIAILAFLAIFVAADCNEHLQRLLSSVSQVDGLKLEENGVSLIRERCKGSPSSECSSIVSGFVSQLKEELDEDDLGTYQQNLLSLATLTKEACFEDSGLVGYSTECQDALNNVKKPTERIYTYMNEKNDQEVITIVDSHIQDFETAIDACKSG